MQRVNTAKWIVNSHRWQINVQKDGVRKSFYSSKEGRTGQREANAKADAWLNDGIDTNNKKIGMYLDKYLEYVYDGTSTSNYRPEKARIEHYLKPAIGNRKFSQVTENDLQTIINKAFKEKHLSKKTLNNLRATIKAFYKWRRKEKLTTLVPEDLKLPSQARLKDKNILQPEDIKILFTEDTTILRNKRVYDDYIHAYRFQILTGLRPGEMRGIKKNDLRGKILNIRRSRNIYNEITTGKNENALRTIELSDLAYMEIKRQMAEHHNKEYVFDFPQASYLQRFRRYCESNGIPPISTYEMRHTFVSIVKTMPEGLVKSIVGHSESMDTFGIYGHVVNGEQSTIAAELQDIFLKILK